MLHFYSDEENKHIYILDGLSETNKSIHNTNARKWPHISVIIDRLCGDISLYNISSVVTHRYICICGWLTGMMAYLTRRLSMNLGRPALNTNLICCCSHLSLHIIVNLPIQERLCFYTSNQSLGTGSLDYYFRCLLFCKCHWASAVASGWREQVLVIMGAFKRY